MRFDPTALASLPLLAGLLLPADALAQDKAASPKTMDYGPFLSATIRGFGEDNVALKGRAVFLGEDAGVVWDSELLRPASMWRNAPLRLRGTAYDGSHGPFPEVQGTMVGRTDRVPGVARDGSFADPREIPFGPLPRDHARYDGLHVHGDDVVFQWHAGDTRVLEHYRTVEAGGLFGIVRTLSYEGGTDLLVRVADQPETPREADGEGAVYRTWLVEDAPEGVALVRDGRTTSVDIPAAPSGGVVQVLYASGVGSGFEAQAGALAVAARTSRPDLSRLVASEAPELWPETVKTAGMVGAADGPFAVDTITLPFDNPYGSYLRFGGFDFLDADRAALSTWNGDVWIVSGLADPELADLEWKRFAAGLHDTLGVKVVDGKVYVHGRDQITRLHDRDGNGEADWYECFNNDVYVTEGFHEFSFDLRTDAEGNFYFSKGGPVNPGGRGFQRITPHHGCVFKLSPDGETLEVVATGLRAPNGIGVGPDGQLTCGDNEGTWMPKCKLHWIRPGYFGGVVDLAHKEERPADYDRNFVCWFPMEIDNSSGGQVWVPEDQWGALGGELLHLSYGQSSIYHVLLQKDGSRIQGGVVRLPTRHVSSCMRGRFHGEGDGHLYVVGLKGWQTNASQLSGFQRVRRTDAPLNMPIAMEVVRGGIRITFDQALDEELATDPQSWSVEQWNYEWSEAYGSPEIAPSDPEKRVKKGERNRDRNPVVAAELSGDGRVVTLRLETLIPVMQMRIAYDLETVDGDEVFGEIHNTIHFVPGGSEDR